MHPRSLVCLVALLLPACAPPSAQHSSEQRPDRNIITAEEIVGAHERNAYDLIQSLRPNMLRTRGSTSISDPGKGIVVFLDDQRFGDLTSLRGLPPSNISQIRFFTAGEAQGRWGPGYPSGVIQVTTKR